MSEAERSIAVKRKIAVTKPISRDDSPSEVYSPKRKRSNASHEEASPPPYIPSRKDAIGRHGGSSSTHRSEQRGLSRDDVRHTLSREDRRELISRSRREELLRTIGIDRESSQRSKSAGSAERGRMRSDSEKNVHVTYEREVIGEGNSGGVKNFQITTRVVSPRPLGSHNPEARKRVSVSPERKQSVQVTLNPRPVASSKASIASRLGKVVVERRNSNDSDDSREDQDTRSASLKSRPERRDAREDINAKVKEAQSKKVQYTVVRKSGARSISRLAKEAVQKQCEAAVISVRSSRSDTRNKGNVSPDRREVQCSADSHSSDNEEEEQEEEEEIVRKKDRVNIEVKGGVTQDILDQVEKVKDVESDDDEAEDLAKMIDDDLEPELLEDTHNDEFTLDLDDDDLGHVVGAIEAEAAEAEIEKADEAKSGTRFIVTLDGVDERQFDGGDSNNTTDKSRRPSLRSTASVSVAPVSLASLGQTDQTQLYLDLLASQGRSLPPPVLQQAQISTQLTASKLTPPKIQPFSISLKDSDDEHDDKEAKHPSTRQGSYHHQEQIEMEEEVGMSALKRARMSERCKFWPACAAGTSCEYHHPTTHCKTFPNCKFGDKCLFIHPNCRFDSKCARPDCPYTHTSRRSLSSAPAHVIAIPQSHVVFSPAPPKAHYGGSYLSSSYPGTQTVCRYFPNCHNLTCPFLHPKPCRFGVACKSPACPFYHPPMPGKDKLKWQAQASVQKGHPSILLGHIKTEPGIVKQASVTAPSNAATVSSTSL